MQGFEQVAGEVGGAGSRCEGEGDRTGFAGVDYGGDGWVEGVGFAPSKVQLVCAEAENSRGREEHTDPHSASCYREASQGR